MCMGTEAVFVSGVRVHNVPRPGIGQASRAVELNLAPLVHMTHAHLSDETCVKWTPLAWSQGQGLYMLHVRYEHVKLVRLHLYIWHVHIWQMKPVWNEHRLPIYLPGLSSTCDKWWRDVGLCMWRVTYTYLPGLRSTDDICLRHTIVMNKRILRIATVLHLTFIHFTCFIPALLHTGCDFLLI